jgi:hypothetical protein
MCDGRDMKNGFDLPGRLMNGYTVHATRRKRIILPVCLQPSEFVSPTIQFGVDSRMPPTSGGDLQSKHGNIPRHYESE